MAAQDADFSVNAGSDMETKLKKVEEKAQAAQQNADLATTQRSALEADLKKAEEKAQAAQQNADLATTQRTAMETELKKAEEKAQQAQQNANLATTQRNEMETELKKARGQLSNAEETAQNGADLVANQPKSEPTPSIAISAESTPGDPQANESSQPSGDEQVIKKFVLDYLQTVASDDITTQESFFAHRVTYFSQGVISIRKIQEAKESFDRQWPKRDWKSKE